VAGDLGTIRLIDSLSKQNCYFITHLASTARSSIATFWPLEDQDRCSARATVLSEHSNVAGNRRFPAG